MKLAAIYNVWDGEEHLDNSYKSIKDYCDIVIAVVQIKSNHGEIYNGGLKEVQRLGIDYIMYEGVNNYSPMRNETAKRNIGIRKAFDLGATHYVLMDCDEVYPDFAKGKEMAAKHDATVCKMVTYFGNETLIYDRPEGYYVPFINRIEVDGIMQKVGNFDNGYLCDPTRKPPLKAVELPIFMHHYSYVRNDIGRKLRNSSAFVNLKEKIPNLVQQVNNAHAGMYVDFVDRYLIWHLDGSHRT
jgi:hypothetical protein